MNLPLNPRQCAQNAIKSGLLIPAEKGGGGEVGVSPARKHWPNEEFDYDSPKVPLPLPTPKPVDGRTARGLRPLKGNYRARYVITPAQLKAQRPDLFPT